jgi:hypothetical protein
MRVTLVSLGLAAVLAACQTASYQGQISSPYYIIPAGSRLNLTQELTFDPDQLSVYIQNGRILSLRRVQVYFPFCKFELNHLSDAARTMQPDEFVVTKTDQYRWEGAFARTTPQAYEPKSLVSLAQFGGGDSPGGPPQYSFITRMDLHSEKQPEIFRLTCLRWAYPGMDEHVSIAEMRKTLSPLFTLRTPTEG